MDINQILAIYGISQQPKASEGGQNDCVIMEGEEELTGKESYADKLRSNQGARQEETIHKVCEDTRPEKGYSFAEIWGNDFDQAIPLKEMSEPKMEGGNVTVEIDEVEYRKGVADNQFSVIGRVFVRRVLLPSTKELKEKLELVWKVPNFRMIPLGRGYYHIFLGSMEDQSQIMSIGAVNLNPGVFRVSRWMPNFNTWNQKQVNAQVWIRIYELPIEYWKPVNLFKIARGTGLPLRIDPRTLAIDSGIYARLLVDVDCSSALPDKILVKRDNSDFFVSIQYEYLPNYCERCGNLGHGSGECRRNGVSDRMENEARSDRRNRSMPENTVGSIQERGERKNIVMGGRYGMPTANESSMAGKSVSVEAQHTVTNRTQSLGEDGAKIVRQHVKNVKESEAVQESSLCNQEANQKLKVRNKFEVLADMIEEEENKDWGKEKLQEKEEVEQSKNNGKDRKSGGQTQEKLKVGLVEAQQPVDKRKKTAVIKEEKIEQMRSALPCGIPRLQRVPVALTGTHPDADPTVFLGSTSAGKAVEINSGVKTGNAGDKMKGSEGKKVAKPKEGGMQQLVKEIALVKSRLTPDHPLNSKCIGLDMQAIANTVNKGCKKLDEVIAKLKPKSPSHATTSSPLVEDKGGTGTCEYKSEDYESTERDEKEEAKEFHYYMTRQACNSARGAKSKRGTRVKGR